MRERLEEALNVPKRLAIAVSGGVDSMTLAVIAHRLRPASVTMIHAISPAVPRSATLRVERYAAQEGWELACLDAGELSDPHYVANPVNRCFFCKTNLYTRMRTHTDATLASGTNTDDLGDYRPGLAAAASAGVIHPFVTAAIDKAGVYALARDLGLSDLAALPPQPCLSSRIQTGIEVTAPTLRLIEDIESLAAGTAPTVRDLRCRVLADGIALEVAPFPADADAAQLEAIVAKACTMRGYAFLGLKPYAKGSAFVGAK